MQLKASFQSGGRPPCVFDDYSCEHLEHYGSVEALLSEDSLQVLSITSIGNNLQHRDIAQ